MLYLTETAYFDHLKAGLRELLPGIMSEFEDLLESEQLPMACLEGCVGPKPTLLGARLDPGGGKSLRFDCFANSEFWLEYDTELGGVTAGRPAFRPRGGWFTAETGPDGITCIRHTGCPAFFLFFKTF